MQYLKFLSLAFIGSAIASPLVARADASTVAADIATVQQKLVALNQSVTAFDGNFINALPVEIKSMDVQKALNQTVNDANASPAFDDNQSATVGLAILNLQPDIFSTLDNLISKKPQFDKGYFLTPIVKQSLVDQRSLSQKLGTAITAKLTPTYASLAPGIIKQIDDKFAQAIKVYSSSFGF